MTPLQAIVLGAVQGLTEFLPVSSSAHLYIVPTLLGWHYEGVAFDVALHLGTLAALLLVFWRDWIQLFAGSVRRGPEGGHARTLLAAIVVGSVPGAIAGFFLHEGADALLRYLPLQAATLAIFGFLLWWVDRRAPVAEPPREIGPPQGAIIGLAQALALVPGVSRSGATITAGRALGLSRVAAARFSFLLATPITLGAGLLESRHLPHGIPAATLALGVASAAITGLLAIQGLLRFLTRAGFGLFFAYRLIVAVVLLVVWRLHAP